MRNRFPDGAEHHLVVVRLGSQFQKRGERAVVITLTEVHCSIVPLIDASRSIAKNCD